MGSSRPGETSSVVGGGGSQGTWSAAAAASPVASGSSFANPLRAGLQDQQQLLRQQDSAQPGAMEQMASGGSGGLYASGLGGTPAVLQAAPLRGGGVTAILQRVQEQVDATER